MRYGYNHDSLRSFSGHKIRPLRSPYGNLVLATRAVTAAWICPIASTTTTNRWMTHSHASLLRCLRHDHSSGILTGCPSSTPFGLDLGPTDPEQINFTQGNLRLTASMFFTCFIATYSDILTSVSSSTPYGMPSPNTEHSPTRTPQLYGGQSAIAVMSFSPGYFRRRFTRLVSCYALFKGWLLLSQLPSCLSKSTSFTT